MDKDKIPYKAYRGIKKSLGKPANTGRGISPNLVKNKTHKSQGTRANQKLLNILEGDLKPANTNDGKTPRTGKTKQSKMPTVTSRVFGGGMPGRGGGGVYDIHEYTKGFSKIGQPHKRH